MINRFLIVAGLLLFTPTVFAQIEEDAPEIENEAEEAGQFTDIAKAGLKVNGYRLGEGLTVRSSEGGKVNLSAFMQTGFEMRNYEGDDQLYNRFRIRRARVRLTGDAYKEKIRYALGVDLVKGNSGDDANNSMLMDAWIGYRPFGSLLTLSIGQRSTPTDNRELFMSSFALQLPDRSKLSSAFGTIREVGIFAESSFKVSKKGYLRPSIAITDGDGPISTAPRYGGLKYGARLSYLPFGLFKMGGDSRQGDMFYELSPKLNISVAASYNNGAIDRKGGNGGSPILYYNDLDQVVLPNFTKFIADFHFKYLGFSLLGEYVKTHVDVPGTITQRARNSAAPSRDFIIDGEQNVAGYIRNRMMVGSAFNIQGGYFFRNYWSVDARYTHFMPEKYSYLNNDLYYNRKDFYEIGITKYLTRSHSVKVQLSYTLINPDGPSRKLNGDAFSGMEGLTNLLMQIRF
ncbi:MAG: porin [Bacteroidales bacterium]